MQVVIEKKDWVSSYRKIKRFENKLQQRHLITANRMLGMIRRSFVNREEKMMFRLYKTYAIPHLEFAIVALSPHMVNDISKLEKVCYIFSKVI